MIADDGAHALTMIAFVGSVFSPFYARARRANPSAVDPEAHCGMNVVLYSLGEGGRSAGRRWAFTEYPKGERRRTAEAFEVGRNRVWWDDDRFCVDFDERTAPVWFGRSMRGQIRVTPSAFTRRSFRLDPDDRHRWWPIAPFGRAEVEVEGLRFSGSAYVDSNWGDEPLGDGFSSWQWSRAELADRAVVLYDAQPRRGEPYERAMSFDANGEFSWLDGERSPVSCPLPRAGYGMPQSTRVDPEAAASDDAAARIVAPLEDAPFYTRNLLETQLLGQRVHAVHEALDMDQWARPVVQAMLPVRMRRRLRPR